MGNQQPKKVGRASKIQVDVAALKAKIHLQLMRDRKNNQIIKGQKQLVQKIKSQSRNKTEEILIAERVVNGLKYAQACNMLMAYAVSLKAQAQFIADNIGNQQKIEPYLMQIHSLLYAADRLGLSSLTEFKNVMKALNDPSGMLQFTNPQIIQLLTPQPTSEELNTYILQMCQRNEIQLEQVNLCGHKFTKYPKGIPSVPSSQAEGNLSFEELQRKMAEEIKRNMYGVNGFSNGQQPNNGVSVNPNQYPSQSFNQNKGGFNQGTYNQGFDPNYMGGNQGFNPTQNNQNYVPTNQPHYIPSNVNLPGTKNLSAKNNNLFDSGFSSDSNPYGIRQSYDPKVIPLVPQKKDTKNTPEFLFSNNQNTTKKPISNPYDSRISINDIDEIDYYPQIQTVAKNVPIFVDPDFDKICQQIRVGL